MLTTPLGDIEIYVDDNKVEYMEKNIRVSDKLCPDVSGRYAIKIDFIPDGKIHTISCKIKGHVSSKKDGIEPGERLELKSFYKDKDGILSMLINLIEMILNWQSFVWNRLEISIRFMSI